MPLERERQQPDDSMNGALMEPFLGTDGLDQCTIGNALADGVFDESGWSSPEEMRHENRRQMAKGVPALHFARLEIYEAIGAGASANVYRGKLSTKDIAAKRFYCEDVTWLELREICHEMLVSWHLQPNRHVVEFKGYCVMPPFIYTIMELCDLGSLYSILHQGAGGFRGTRRERICWSIDCVEVVSYLHRHGFYHRDVKSPNFIAKRDHDAPGGLKIKLCDFGASARNRHKDAMDRSAHKGPVGTIQWMAPEIIGAADVLTAFTAAADVYSTGVVVWECLTSEHPFEEVGVVLPRQALIAHILSGARPKSDLIDSVGVKVALDAAWKQDPRQRGTLQDLHDALHQELQVTPAAVDTRGFRERDFVMPTAHRLSTAEVDA